MNLIDKDALVAEIERRREESWLGHYTKEKGIVFDITDDILSFINTLEVKEVDLEKEYEEFVVDDPILGNFITNDTMGMKLAKHFFELGFMYTLSWKDIKLIAEIGEEFMNSEESDAYTNDESYYNAILNKLKEKGLDYKTQRQEMRDIKAQKGK